jgi:katanin p60 ATPase-containing subunit A1
MPVLHHVLRPPELMLRKRLTPDRIDSVDFERFAGMLEGYSGSDITLLCKEAAMRPVRRLMDKLEALEGTRAAAAIVGSEMVKLDLVTSADVEAAVAVTKPSARFMEEKYTSWQAEFSST